MAKDPVHGNPNEFERLEELFRNIKVRTEDLESDLRAIASGTSRDFRGDAADAFSTSLTDLAPALHEVPDIAHRVEQIFCDHKNQLIQLQGAADSAVARAETNWNEQQRADSIYDDANGDLRRVRLQLLWTWDDADRTRLECRRDDLEDDVAVARTRLDCANDDWEKSEAEIENLAKSEEELNERTAKDIERVDVGVLADPGWLEKLIDFAVDAVSLLSGPLGPLGILLENLSTETLQLIREVLDIAVFVLTYIGLVLDVLSLIPIVGVIAAAIGFYISIAAVILSTLKLKVSIELYQRGVLTGAELALDVVGLALSLVGLIPLADLTASGIFLKTGAVGFGLGLTLGAWSESAADDNMVEAGADWQVCEAPMPSWTDGSESFGSYVVEIPEVDMFRPADGALSLPKIEPVSFTGNISVIDAGSFDAIVMDLDLNFDDLSIDDLANVVYEMGDLDLDSFDLEISIDSHFSFSPPEVVFADFYQAFEQDLRPLLVPCELGT